MYEFRWPTRTLFGEGLIERVGEYVAPSPAADRLLLVAPREEWIRPLVEGICSRLREAGWERVETFAEVEPNPSWETVARGVERGGTAGASAVLAVGGGSTMDAGKVIAERCGAALLCTVPTTAGTGGEISPWAVISNVETREKDSVVAKWPDVALLDPTLTLSLPPRTTLFTGADAFIHGLEAYVASAATPITDALALMGMELVASHLRAAVEHGDDLETRGAMLQGSLLTGAAMLHAGLGLMHAIGNVAGGLYHEWPHGLVLMRCMDAVLEFNRPAMGPKFARVQPLVKQVRSEVESLFAELAMPEVEIARADLSLLLDRAAANVNARTNPRNFTLKELEEIVRSSFVVL
ncbi:MAG: iron-containing alcohol dehydrogenase [Chloroflexota bacterium]|nr:iron-containing alcohol dehydrogenase [Chloroflexota bacterium]